MYKLHDAMFLERSPALHLRVGIASSLLLGIMCLSGCAGPTGQGKDAPDDTGASLDDTSQTVESGDELSCEDLYDPADCDTGQAAAVDADGDGVPSTTDCDDTNPWIYPGATETCDGVDDDCDGVTWLEEDAYGCVDFYEDGDHDTYGYDGGATSSRCFCDDDGEAPVGTEMVNPVPVGGDCDDTDDAHYPGAPPRCDDWADDDCDGESELSPDGSDLTYYIDRDEDGWGTRDPTSTSCGEALPAEGSGAPPEELCLCSGEVAILEADWSSAGVPRLEALEVTVTGSDGAEVTAKGYLVRWGDLQWRFLPPEVALDCDDSDPDYCWTILYPDVDTDGYGDETGAGSPLCPDTSGFTTDHGDCDDRDPDIHPTAVESCNDGDGTDDDNVDRDCDGTKLDTNGDDGTLYYLDLDGDRFGYPDAELGRRFCVSDPDDEEPYTLGYSPENTDCDDLCDQVNPEAEEICGDNSDNDCDGLTDSDDECSTPEDTTITSAPEPCSEATDEDGP